MFGIIADLIASVTTILLPIYASYKALRSSDPAQLTPWLLYWTVLSSLLLIESWTVFIIGWFPFYSWIRLFCLSYLVLPQTQGAKILYYTYIEPFIVQHEKEIDVFIGKAHEQASALGLDHLNQLINFVYAKVLGQTPLSQPSQTSAAGAAGAASYATNLFSRFAIPAARTGVAGPASDFYGMLSGAVAAATSTIGTTAQPGSSTSHARDLQAEDLSASGLLYPRRMGSTAEKRDFISSQRDRLTVLLKALDKEEQNLDLAYGEDGGASLRHDRKNKSTHSFEEVAHEDAMSHEYDGRGTSPSHHHQQKRRSAGADRRTPSGNWIPSGWWPGSASGTGTPPPGSGSPGWNTARDITEAVQGMSSGVDTHR